MTADRERAATSIEHYIDRRQLVGSLTAELSYLLISPLLKKDSEALRYLMKDVGAVGCLVDSVIDFRADAYLGLVSFDATVRNFLVLLATTVREGFKISIRYPTLLRLFIASIIDNIGDRFRAQSPVTSSQPKEAAPSVI